jgi:hypothetical protein
MDSTGGDEEPNADQRRAPRAAFGILLLVYIGAALLYSWLMPPWEAPDEPAHFVLAANLARIGKFSSVEANYEGHQPQPYYRLMSVPLKWLHKIDPAWIQSYRPDGNFDNLRTEIPVFGWTPEIYRFLPGLYLLRWINILIGAAAVSVNYLALRRLLPGNPRTAFTATVFLAFIPQYLHISASVGNDPVGSLAGAVLFWLLVRVTTAPWGMGGFLLSGLAAVGLPLATKLTAIPMGVVVLAAAALRARAARRIPWWAVAAGGAGLIGLAALVGIALPRVGAIWAEVITGRALLTITVALTFQTRNEW